MTTRRIVPSKTLVDGHRRMILVAYYDGTRVGFVPDHETGEKLLDWWESMHHGRPPEKVMP